MGKGCAHGSRERRVYPTVCRQHHLNGCEAREDAAHLTHRLVPVGHLPDDEAAHGRVEGGDANVERCRRER